MNNRENSSTYGEKMEVMVKQDKPTTVIIPANIVHAYKNIGKTPGLVINFPNKLFAGWGKKEKVDEVRHENAPNSKFKVDL